MSGIYIHIPFCLQACYYCDFHFSTNGKAIHRMSSAIANELKMQHDYLKGSDISTIYFGGGTPSLLPATDLQLIFESIQSNFVLAEQLEVTLEMNPEDVTPESLQRWKSMGINRISVGIQTFQDDLLKFLNRAHDSIRAIESLELISANFNNFNLDLIYGIPHASKDRLTKDIQHALDYKPSHISAYALTIEPKTVFGKWRDKNKLEIVNDDVIADEFHFVHEQLANSGYEHYEVSNYAKSGFISKHNSGYWNNEKYLGVGPSAHSYDSDSRQFNVSNNAKYMKSIEEGKLPANIETLSLEMHVNDYLLTSLRTKWGVSIEKLKREWGYDLLNDKGDYLLKLCKDDYAFLDEGNLVLTTKGLLLADQFAAELIL